METTKYSPDKSQTKVKDDSNEYKAVVVWSDIDKTKKQQQQQQQQRRTIMSCIGSRDLLWFLLLWLFVVLVVAPLSYTQTTHTTRSYTMTRRRRSLQTMDLIGGNALVWVVNAGAVADAATTTTATTTTTSVVVHDGSGPTTTKKRKREEMTLESISTNRRRRRYLSQVSDHLSSSSLSDSMEQYDIVTEIPHAHLPPSTDCGKNRRNNHHYRKNRVNPKPSQQQQQSPPSSFFQSPPTTTTPPPPSPTSTLEPITNYPTFFLDFPTFHKPITNYPTFVPRAPSRPPPPSPPSSTSTTDGLPPTTTPTTNTATTTMPSFSDLVPTRTLVPQPGRQEEQRSDSPSHVPLFTMSKKSFHPATTTTARPSPSGSSSNGKKKSKRMEPLSLGPATSTIHPSSFPVARPRRPTTPSLPFPSPGSISPSFVSSPSRSVSPFPSPSTTTGSTPPPPPSVQASSSPLSNSSPLSFPPSQFSVSPMVVVEENPPSPAQVPSSMSPPPSSPSFLRSSWSPSHSNMPKGTTRTPTTTTTVAPTGVDFFLSPSSSSSPPTTTENNNNNIVDDDGILQEEQRPSQSVDSLGISPSVIVAMGSVCLIVTSWCVQRRRTSHAHARSQTEIEEEEDDEDEEGHEESCSLSPISSSSSSLPPPPPRQDDDDDKTPRAKKKKKIDEDNRPYVGTPTDDDDCTRDELNSLVMLEK